MRRGPPLSAWLVAAAAAVVLVPRVPERREVRLENNRFQPALVTARAGDTLLFVNGRGGPHNVQFADDSLTDVQHRLIDAAMPDRPRATWSRDVPLAGPLLVLEGDTYRVIVPDLPPGRYRFFCTPHVSGGMRGELVLVP
ncbi:MAG: hypothetical protein HUU26_03060 [Gemmatimonadaceae bacterium]|nr:hypothetical protein [Gemmatimonadaceae bacterium]